MLLAGEHAYLDDERVAVEDRITLTEPGEDGDSWTLYVLRGEAQAMPWLVEDDGDEKTIYRAIEDRQQRQISWEEEQRLKVSSKGPQLSGTAIYREGSDAEGRWYLGLDDLLWEMEDYVVEHPIEGFVRASTPATSLPAASPPEPPTGRQLGGTIGWVLTAIVFAHCLLSLVFPLARGFEYTLWILGWLAMIAAAASHPGAGTVVLGGAFATYLTTSSAAPALLSAIPAIRQLLTADPSRAGAMWAMLLLVLLLVLAPLARKPFFIFAEGMAVGGFVAAALYTLGLACVACGDEDLSWFGSWTWYFRASPYCFIWPALQLLMVIYYYFDYRKVPMTHRGFLSLRDRAAAMLRSDDPLRKKRVVGDAIDDLADAIRISEDRRLKRLLPYHRALLAAAMVLRGLDKTVGRASLGALADRVCADLALLADEIEKMPESGAPFRLSPALQLLASNNPEKDEWLASRANPAARGPYRA